MIDDLVKRLRDLNDHMNTFILDEAADRIEQLEAALRTVKEEHGYGLPLETTRMINAVLEGQK